MALFSDPVLEATLRGKSDQTRTSYTYALARCLKITHSTTLKQLLMGRAHSYKKLSAAYPHPPSLKTTLATICSIITANDGIVPNAYVVFWRARMGDAIKASAELSANNVASPELLKKWIQYEDIKTKLDQLLTDEGHTKNRMSLDIVMLAVYAFLAPKRRDFGELHIVQKEDDIADDENGIVISAEGVQGKLVLNAYKTAKAHGRFVEVLHEELTMIIKASVDAHPRLCLFSGPLCKPLSDNAYGKRVSDVMDRHLDKKRTVNDLRQLYITQTEQQQVATMTLAQRAAHSRSMKCT